MHPDDLQTEGELVTVTSETVSLPPVGLYLNVDVNDLLDTMRSQAEVFEFIGKLKDLVNA
jgi:hypothetical protein